MGKGVHVEAREELVGMGGALGEGQEGLLVGTPSEVGQGTPSEVVQGNGVSTEVAPTGENREEGLVVD